MEDIRAMIKRISADDTDIIHVLAKYYRICGIVDTDLSQLYDDECAEKLFMIKRIIDS